MRRKSKLMAALVDVGHKLDAARDPVEMKRLISQRKRISAALEDLAPRPPLRIFRGSP